MDRSLIIISHDYRCQHGKAHSEVPLLIFIGSIDSMPAHADEVIS